ncbi:MAG: hypothetical protein OXF11_19480 [Deltaproteobacteria bacterium]|nr:hypothetical protein [Deltaproteobacteria bacterium]
MTVIVLEVYEALIEAGASKEKAKAAAAAIPHAERLATKEDISGLEQSVARLEHGAKSDIANLELSTKEEFARQESSTKEEFAKQELSTKEEFARLELSTKKEFARLEKTTREDIARLDKNVAVLKLAVFTFEPAIIALLVKLLFFP